MSVIICDASPILALHGIGRLDLLQLVYQEIVITDVVEKEVEIDLPEWIIVTAEYDNNAYTTLNASLDSGEASSIAYAMDIDQAVLIIDEKKGRKVARKIGLNIIGLLGVIVKAKKEGRIPSGMQIISDLEKSNFRVSESLYELVKTKLGE
ncbi:MAG: DUF3368 domain-containing protein [Bacteroidota bacterium]